MPLRYIMMPYIRHRYIRHIERREAPYCAIIFAEILLLLTPLLKPRHYYISLLFLAFHYYAAMLATYTFTIYG